MIAERYFALPEQTATAWRNGWYHTGDMFRVTAGGDYCFVDRSKDVSDGAGRTSPPSSSSANWWLIPGWPRRLAMVWQARMARRRSWWRSSRSLA